MLVRFLWTAVIFLAFIGFAVAVRRSIVLSKPGALSAQNNPAAELDNAFANRRTLTLAHILPAMLFMVLGPLQFVRSLRSRYPQVHQWSGRISDRERGGGNYGADAGVRKNHRPCG